MSKEEQKQEVETSTEPPKEKHSPETNLFLASVLLVDMKDLDAIMSEKKEITVNGITYSAEKRFYKKIALLVAEERNALIKDIKKISESL